MNYSIRTFRNMEEQHFNIISKNFHQKNLENRAELAFGDLLEKSILAVTRIGRDWRRIFKKIKIWIFGRFMCKTVTIFSRKLGHVLACKISCNQKKKILRSITNQSCLKEVCKISTRSVHWFLRNRVHWLQKHSFLAAQRTRRKWIVKISKVV